jgi:LPS export ABC transporter protein LptC
MAKASKLHRLTLLAGLAGFAVMVTYVTFYWDSSQPAMLLRAPDPNQVDLYAEQPRGAKFDADGKLVQSFRAERLTHYRLNDHAVLAAPVFQLVTDRGDIWNTTARTATLVGESEVQLRGDVMIADQPRTRRLNTEALQWYPPQQRVESKVAVTLVQQLHTTRAVGMHADLNTDRIELLHQVEGTHVLP